MNHDVFNGLGIQIDFKEYNDFLKIKETLTRIGVESKRNHSLYQSCLPNSTKIYTTDGIKTIQDIVENKYMGKVLSVNNTTGTFEYKNIISHSVVDNVDKQWCTLICTDNVSFKRSTTTTDHKIAFVPDILNPSIEYMDAIECNGEYIVRNIFNGDNHLHNENSLYSKTQISILVGMILGDSTITRSGVVQTLHSNAQLSYNKHISDVFDCTLKENIQNNGFSDNLANITYVSSNAQTKLLRNKIYNETSIKKVESLLELIDDISLAYWYMDDGNISTYSSGTEYAILNTQGFNLEEHELLKDMFNDKFDIKVQIDTYIMDYNGEEKTYNRLRFNKDDSEKLFSIISKYIIPSMNYKLPTKYHQDYIPLNYENISYSASLVKDIKIISKEYNPKYLSSKLYDIEVEDNHNFIANDTLVHNCHILHKKGYYAILHFKELFELDGKYSDITSTDLQRRNTIVKLLNEWGLVDVVNEQIFYSDNKFLPMNKVKIISFKDKNNWNLESKYTIGDNHG